MLRRIAYTGAASAVLVGLTNQVVSGLQLTGWSIGVVIWLVVGLLIAPDRKLFLYVLAVGTAIIGVTGQAFAGSQPTRWLILIAIGFSVALLIILPADPEEELMNRNRHSSED